MDFYYKKQSIFLKIMHTTKNIWLNIAEFFKNIFASAQPCPENHFSTLEEVSHGDFGKSASKPATPSI